MYSWTGVSVQKGHPQVWGLKQELAYLDSKNFSKEEFKS